MAIRSIPVDQRVIDVDSRRFAYVEKALVELITNSDDSYARLAPSTTPTTGLIRIGYERHQGGALLQVTDQAEGMSHDCSCRILAYGAAHSPLARGEHGGRGYFGRGLKQAIYGLGHGWIETIQAGRFTRIDLFRSDNGGYLFDDGGGDRPALAQDRERLGLPDNGTRVSIVIDNPQVRISHYLTLIESVRNNLYLRDILARRQVELVNLQHGKAMACSGRVQHEEPPAVLLLGPDLAGSFEFAQQVHDFHLTLQRADGVELSASGDERSNGLLVRSGTTVLDCQLFDFEKQLGTEYLFGTVDCPALIEQLGLGRAIINDEREGLNLKDAFVIAFSHAVSALIAPCVRAEQEKLKHLQVAVTSDRTSHMIEQLLQRMNRAALQDLGLNPPDPELEPPSQNGASPHDALRFSTPFYYRQPGHAFHVRLLLDPALLAPDDTLRIDYSLPASLHIDARPGTMPVRALQPSHQQQWTLQGDQPGVRGELTARVGDYWAWCEIVLAEHASPHGVSHPGHFSKKARPRDHGTALFTGYALRQLDNDLERAVYCPRERKILINTLAPTVQLYVDGRGHFRDSARLLLAELFMDVIADELARRLTEKSGHPDDSTARHAAKLEVIRRYGSDIHRVFLGSSVQATAN